jgi:hypothetical protein
MTHFSAALLMSGSEGCVHVRIWDERYYICAEEVGMIVFVGDIVPLLRRAPASAPGTVQVAGTVHLNPSGQAVIFEIGMQRYMISRDRFIAVALGTEISAPIFEIATDEPEPEMIVPSSGGAA